MQTKPQIEATGRRPSVPAKLLSVIRGDKYMADAYPAVRLREIGETIGITERAAHRIVSDLAAAGYLARERHGRRNRYTIEADLPVPDPLAHTRKIGELLELLNRR